MSYLMDAFKIVSIFISSIQSLTYLQYHYQESVVGPIIKTLHIHYLVRTRSFVPYHSVKLASMQSWIVGCMCYLLQPNSGTKCSQSVCQRQIRSSHQRSKAVHRRHDFRCLFGPSEARLGVWGDEMRVPGSGGAVGPSVLEAWRLALR